MSVKGKRVIRWTTGTSLTALLTYLLLAGSITIQSSPSEVCVSNPCIALINVTCQKTFRVYGNTGTKVSFSPEISHYSLQNVKSGVEVDLSNFSCKRGIKHEWKLTGWKVRPWENVKWGVDVGSASLDPAWLGKNWSELVSLQETQIGAGRNIVQFKFHCGFNYTFQLGKVKQWLSTGELARYEVSKKVVTTSEVSNNGVQTCTTVSVVRGAVSNVSNGFTGQYSELVTSCSSVPVFVNVSSVGWERATNFSCNDEVRVVVERKPRLGWFSADWVINLSGIVPDWLFLNASYGKRLPYNLSMNYTTDLRGAIVYLNISSWNYINNVSPAAMQADCDDLVPSNESHNFPCRRLYCGQNQTIVIHRQDIPANIPFDLNNTIYMNNSAATGFCDYNSPFANNIPFAFLGNDANESSANRTTTVVGTPTFFNGLDCNGALYCMNASGANGVAWANTALNINSSNVTLAFWALKNAFTADTNMIRSDYCDYTPSDGIMTHSGGAGDPTYFGWGGNNPSLACIDFTAAGEWNCFVITYDSVTTSTTGWRNGTQTCTGNADVWHGSAGLRLGDANGCIGWGGYNDNNGAFRDFYILNYTVDQNWAKQFCNQNVKYGGLEGGGDAGPAANVAPLVTLISPADAAKPTTGTLSFQFNASDGDNITFFGATLWRNATNASYLASVAANFTATMNISTHPVGNFTWNITLDDGVVMGNSTKRTFTVVPANTAPSVALNAPASGSKVTTGLTAFQFTPSDADNTTLYDCTLLRNSTNVSSIATTPQGFTGTFNYSIPVGNWSWTTSCFDGISTGTSSANSLMSVPANTAPSVTLGTPLTNAVLTNGTLAFTYTPADIDNATLDCTLYRNVTNASFAAGVSQTLNTLNVLTSPGNYSWRVDCFDGILNASSSSNNLKVNPSNVPPIITLVAPVDAVKLTTGTLAFQFSMTDNENSTMDGCSMYRNATNASYLASVATGGFVATMNITTHPVGNFTWNITCFDGDLGNSSKQTFMVVPANTAPVVSLVAPLEANVSNTAAIVNYSATVTDGENTTLQWCAARLNTTVILNNITSITSPGTFNVSTNRTEGNYSWNIICSDGISEASGSARAIKIVPVNALPSVTLSSPTDATVFTVGFINFTYTPADLTNSTLDCSLLRNTTNVSFLAGVSQQLSNFSIATTSVGNYSWNVTCFDGLLSGTSSVRTFKVVPANTAPVVTLLSPASGDKFSNGTALNFSFNVTDEDNVTLSWCSVTRNLTTIMGNLSSVSLGRLNVSIPLLAVGNYSWNASCSDASLEAGGTPRVFSVVKNNTAPVVTLISPINLSNVSSRVAVNFTFNVTDDENVTVDLFLVLNNTFYLNLTSQAVGNLRVSNITQNLSGLGRFYWTINASDGLSSGKGVNWTFLLTDQFSFNISKQASFKYNFTNTSTLIAQWGQNGSLGGFNVTNTGSYATLWMKIAWRNTTTTRVLDSYFDSNWTVSGVKNYSRIGGPILHDTFSPYDTFGTWVSAKDGTASWNVSYVNESWMIFQNASTVSAQSYLDFNFTYGWNLTNFSVSAIVEFKQFDTGTINLLWFSHTSAQANTTGWANKIGFRISNVSLANSRAEFYQPDGGISNNQLFNGLVLNVKYKFIINRTWNGSDGYIAYAIYNDTSASDLTNYTVLSAAVDEVDTKDYCCFGSSGDQGGAIRVVIDDINFSINKSYSYPVNNSVSCIQFVSESGGNVSAPHGSRMGRLDYHFNSTATAEYNRYVPFNGTPENDLSYYSNINRSFNESYPFNYARKCPSTNNVTFPLFGSNYSAGGINLSQGYTTIGLSVRGNESLTDNITLLLNGSSICKSVRPADYSGWFNLSCTVPNSTYLYKVGIGIIQTNFSINHSKYGVPYSVYVDWLRVWNTSDPSTYAQFRIAVNGSLTGTHIILTGTEQNITSINASSSKFLWNWMNFTSWRPVLFDLLWRVD